MERKGNKYINKTRVTFVGQKNFINNNNKNKDPEKLDDLCEFRAFCGSATLLKLNSRVLSLSQLST